MMETAPVRREELEGLTMAKAPATQTARTRLIAMLLAGLAAGVVTGFAAGWVFAPTAGWAVACAVYVLWVWVTIGPMDEAATKRHAQAEDPTRPLADILVIIASVAGLVAVVILILVSKNAHGLAKVVIPIFALLSVALSWFLIHTLFTLRYALLYFDGKDGGIDFNQDEPPRYSDFAYLSFTLGMTYQVSDTDLQLRTIRATALRQGLLSYLFGAVILAATINLVAGLAN
jgi:uncharacterized membrane protein